MSDLKHPLAERYGNCPWVLHEADGPNGETWTCTRHPEVSPFGPKTDAPWYCTPTSHVHVSNVCPECVCATDPELSWRPDFWRRYYADYQCDM